MSYLLSFMSLMGAPAPIVPVLKPAPPQIEYIAVVDVGASDQEDANDRMVLGFAGDHLVYNTPKQIQLVSVMRGVCALAGEFSQASSDGGATIINGDSNSIIIYPINEGFHIMCSVRHDPKLDSCQSSLAVQQVTRMIGEAYRLFKMHNTSIACFVEEYPQTVVRQLLSQFWGGFVTSYNLGTLECCLGYRGFLGLLPSCDAFRKSDSSWDMEGNIIATQFIEKAPQTLCGLLVANFKKDLVKQYGLVGLIDSIGNKPISTESLIDVYNWLEYLDCAHKLDIPTLTNVNNEQIFNDSGRTMDPPALEQSAYTYQDYITQPINSTILTVMDGFGGVVRSSESVWSNLPGMSGMFSMFNESASAESVSESVCESPTTPEPDRGHYLLGLTGTETNPIIYRKMVYLEDRSGSGHRYHLVVYCQEDVYTIMLFDESEDSLGSATTYTNFECLGLANLSKQIGGRGSVVPNGASLSLLSLANLMPAATGDGSFFYIVYDTLKHSFTSSLPYIPCTKQSSFNLISIHKQLSLLFALPQYSAFYENTHMDEYFHKFTSPESSNWLFYFIKHKNQQIIIIEKQLPGNQKPPTLALAQASAETSSPLGKTSHGFLENLGGDVRHWLESILTTNTEVSSHSENSEM